MIVDDDDEETLDQCDESIYQMLGLFSWLMSVFMWIVWVDALGSWAPVVYALLYVLATNVYLPGWILQLTAGFLFGMALGLGTMVVSITTSALVCLLLTRWACGTCARRRILHRWPRYFTALEGALLQHEWKVMFLVRLSPACPFTATNQMLSLTEVRLRVYGVATLLGTLPNAVMYVSLGATAHSLSAAVRSRCSFGKLISFRCGHPAQEAVMFAGLLATLVLVPLMGWLARRALRRLSVYEHQPEEAEAEDEEQQQQEGVERMRIV